MSSKHEKNTMNTFLSLINKILNDPQFFRLRCLLLFSAVLGWTTIIYNSMLFSCGLYLLQNGGLVYIATLIILSAGKIFDLSERIKLGVVIAVVLGALYASVTLLISNIQYYFFGIRERAFLAKGIIAPQTTPQTLWIELGSQLVFFLFLVLISSFAGFLASITTPPKILK